MYLRAGSIIPIGLQLFNGATGLFPQAVLRDGAGAAISGSPVNLTHAINGLYVNNAFAMPSTATVYVQYLVYTDAARTILSTAYETVIDRFVLDTTPLAAANAAAVRTELAVELARIDAATSTRLATAGYTAPLNTPTLAQIEASTVLAKEATVASRASQTSVNAIPTNPLLTTDSRLNNLDVAVSTRLATVGYTAPTTAPTAAANAAAVRTELGTELARMDVAVSTRLATVGYTAPTTAPTAAANATAVRSELATELARIDAATSTRLATAGYTAPLNTPTLAQIEASTVLAKEATVASRASQASVGALGAPAQAAALATLSSTNQTEHDATQAAIAALPAPPNAPDVAVAVLAAAQTTPIYSDMRRTNGQNIIGDGTINNKFRSSLVG